MNGLRTVSVVCGVAGVLAALLGSVWLGYLFYQAYDYREVAERSIPVQRWIRMEGVSVKPGESGQVGVRLTVRSDHVEIDETGDDVTYEPQYSWPFEYRIRSANGTILSRNNETITPESLDRDVESRDAGPRRGTITARHDFEPFPIPESVRSIDVKARLGSDEQFRSTLIDAHLLVYDSVYDVGLQWMWSVALFGLSGLLLFVGALLFVVKAFRKQGEEYDWSPSRTTGGETVPSQSDQKNWASYCHLAALAMWIGVPFGNLLGPLIVWLMKKDEMPFVDVHGREALNFQISMFLYSFVAFFFVVVFVGFVVLVLLPFINTALVLAATLKAGHGKVFRYPLTLRFL